MDLVGITLTRFFFPITTGGLFLSAIFLAVGIILDIIKRRFYWSKFAIMLFIILLVAEIIQFKFIYSITGSILNNPDKTTNWKVPTSDTTASWKAYQNKNVAFKFPSRWIEKPILTQGSGFTQEFKDPENKFSFTFSAKGNYNQATGKPYVDLDEYVNMPYRVKTVTVDSQEGRQPLPRAGGENINSVMFFSKNSKFIYTLELKTGNTALDTPATDVKEGEKLFDQILSTFKFLP